jgi:hypothetical protein
LSLAKGDGSGIPSWIHVNSAATGKIISVLDFWSSVSSKFSTRDILQAHTATSPASVLDLVDLPNISDEFRASAEARIAMHRQEVMDTMKLMNSTQLRSMGLAPPGPNASAEEKREYNIRGKEVMKTASTSTLVFAMRFLHFRILDARNCYKQQRKHDI